MKLTPYTKGYEQGFAGKLAIPITIATDSDKFTQFATGWLQGNAERKNSQE